MERHNLTFVFFAVARSAEPEIKSNLAEFLVNEQIQEQRPPVGQRVY